jgi:hypothetical protein
MTCSNGFTFYLDNINSETYNFIESMNISETDVVCNYEFCDGHTDLILTNYEIEQKSSNIVDFKFDSKNLNKLYTTENADIKTSVSSDRINFNVSFINVSKTGSYKIYYKTSDKSYYVPSDKYKAWIIDVTSRTWFDMNELGKNIRDIKVFYNGSGLYEITLYSDKSKDFAFQSIGKINCESHSFSISGVEDTSIDILNFSFTQKNVWIYFIFIFFYVSLLFMAFSFKNFMIGYFAFIIGILLAFMSLGVSVILTIAFFFINIIFFITFGKYSNS